MIYLDNAATTKVAPDVAQLVADTLRESFANPSAVYESGMHCEDIISDARRCVAAVLSVKPASVYFTSGGTEANHIGITGLYYARRGYAENIVVSGYEHPSVGMTLERLAIMHGVKLRKVLPSADGIIDPDEVIARVDDKTAMVCVMHVNNETGAIFDFADIVGKVRQKNRRAAIFCDGVQGYLKQSLPVELGGVDAYTLSGHKVGAPKGVGALYLRAGVNYEPVMVGGGQENGIRCGTENVAGIAALGEVSRQLRTTVAHRAQVVGELRDVLLGELGGLDYVINSPKNASPYILNLSFKDTQSAVLQRALDELGLMVSAGSSCSKGANSKTLTAMSLSPERIASALRISFSPDNTPDECRQAAEYLKTAVRRMNRVLVGS